MIIDCISDLHGHYPKLDGGDLLIVAGDLTARDEPQQHLDFADWLDCQAYTKKIVIAGNHDNNIDPDSIECLRGCSYLQDSGCEFENLKIWGTPWTLTFPGINPHCCAFTIDSDEKLAEKWALIPTDVDILVTHGPMRYILDINKNGYACGSSSLKDRIDEVAPYFHIFGHIHEQGGSFLSYTKFIRCFNCSYVDEHYQPVNKPIRIIL